MCLDNLRIQVEANGIRVKINDPQQKESSSKIESILFC